MLEKKEGKCRLKFIFSLVVVLFLQLFIIFDTKSHFLNTAKAPIIQKYQICVYFKYRYQRKINNECYLSQNKLKCPTHNIMRNLLAHI